MQRRSEDDPRFLCRTPAGIIFKGDYVYFVKLTGPGGRMTVRSADPLGRWINGVSDKGHLRSVRPERITRITRKVPA